MNLLEYYPDIAMQYPEHITKLQFCEICGIGKSTAYKLLKSGKVSYEECVERLLHYYKIPLIEALKYKYDKEVEGVLSDSDADNTRTYYENILVDYDDALSILDIHMITGYSKETIRRWIIQGYIIAVKVREKIKVSKEDFIDFATSKRYRNICRKIKKHKNITTTYEQILKDYPEHMSKEQMRLICHISKKSARLLLQTGLIPCVNNGKKTRNYQIATVDVIEYLKQREATPEKYIVTGFSA